MTARFSFSRYRKRYKSYWACMRKQTLVSVKPKSVQQQAAIRTQDSPVLLLPVVQVVGPGLPGEVASLLRAWVPSVDLLVSLQFARKGEPHFAAFVGAPVRRQLGVLFTHVGFKLLVLLELESAAVEPAHVLLPVRSVYAADVPVPIRVRGEGFLAAVYGAAKRLHATVTEVMPDQVRLATEGLSAIVAVTCKRFYSRVFTQMRVQLPLLVISCLASSERADITFEYLRISFHC